LLNAAKFQSDRHLGEGLYSVLHELPAIAGKAAPQKTLNSNAKIGFVWPIINYWLVVGIFLAMS
jgi:hypothetical protein